MPASNNRLRDCAGSLAQAAKSLAPTANRMAKSAVRSALDAFSLVSRTIASGRERITGTQIPTLRVLTYFNEEGYPRIVPLIPESMRSEWNEVEKNMVLDSLLQGFSDSACLENVRAAAETYQNVNKQKGRDELTSAIQTVMTRILYEFVPTLTNLKFRVEDGTSDAVRSDPNVESRPYKTLLMRLDSARFSVSLAKPGTSLGSREGAVGRSDQPRSVGQSTSVRPITSLRRSTSLGPSSMRSQRTRSEETLGFSTSDTLKSGCSSI